MHQSRRLDDLAAEHRTDALMPEADAEDWYPGTEPAHNFIADSGVSRAARPGRDANPPRSKGLNFCDGDFVIPPHDHLAFQLPEILDEVVGEGIVVIDDEDLIHSSPG